MTSESVLIGGCILVYVKNGPCGMTHSFLFSFSLKIVSLISQHNVVIFACVFVTGYQPDMDGVAADGSLWPVA